MTEREKEKSFLDVDWIVGELVSPHLQQKQDAAEGHGGGGAGGSNRTTTSPRENNLRRRRRSEGRVATDAIAEASNKAPRRKKNRVRLVAVLL